MITPSVSRHRWLAALAIGAAVVVADQLTKAWALDALADGSVIELIWTLQLRLVFNTGAAFSFGRDLGPILGLVAAAAVVVLLRVAHRAPGAAVLVGIGLVAGGAAGNLADRALRSGEGFLGGAVIDFIDLGWWPVFNVADMAIVSGAALLVLSTWLSSRVDGG